MALSLTFEKPRAYASGIQSNFSHYAVKANTTIWAGQVLSTDVANHAGLVLPHDAAGTFTTPRFVGFAEESVVNVTGKRVRATTKGRIILAAITNMTGATNIGATVHASNDDTFTDTSTATTVPIGKVADYVAGEGFHVQFEGFAIQSV